MKTASPLRYPGGKSALAGLLSDIRKLNGLGNRSVAEPFAGGAGASLRLLYLEETPRIYINDADSAIYDFWWGLLNRPRSFLEMLSNTRVTIPEWRRHRAIYSEASDPSRVRRGFSTFFLNRCNRSGIIMNGGPIGGVAQRGTWKLDARFNKAELRRRCEKIAEYRDRIQVSGDDGLHFIETIDLASSFLFIDPPYFKKGPMLYLNSLDDEYHVALAARLKTMSDAAWVLTYDDCPEVRRIYCGWAAIRPFSLRYAAAERRPGNEILITPKWMKLPTVQGSAAVTW